MMRWLGLWFLRVLVAFAAVSLAAYAIDWAVFKLRGTPQSTVVVNRYMSIPLKGQKTEYDFLGNTTVSCVVALFPHGDEDPCWYLRRNSDQWKNVGAPAY
jgi:hypothetical protein